MPYVGSQADLWSMGVIIFEMLCGKLPFKDDIHSTMSDKMLVGDIIYIIIIYHIMLHFFNSKLF